MKLTFEKLCELGVYAKELAKKVGHYCAAQWLKAKGVTLRDALAIFKFNYPREAVAQVW